ncbi:DNA-binding protein [Pilimelia anulata]|nr:DNA-binding protein [Pilimelia anulata]
MVRSNGWTAERIRALGTLVDIPTAGRIFGKGRSAAYAAAHTGTFPVPITIIGQRRWVTVASILAVLGLPAEPTPNPVAPPTT